MRPWVQSGAVTTEIAGLHGGALKLRVPAPPADGAANDAVRAFLAETGDVRTSAVEILSGERSRDKLVLVRDVTSSALLEGFLRSA